jgi:hypothetical protein
MTNDDITAATKVPKTTFYRWRDGDWNRDPSASHVRAFFEGLQVPVTVAYAALDWADQDAGPAEAEPPLEPEFREILRKLQDPTVPEAEKQFLRESIKMLASRGQQRGPSKKAAS